MKGLTKPKATKRGGRKYGPGRPTLEDLAQRKQTIIQVATNLFLKHGYAETSLVDIAKLAGVATRTIYQHYGDKEAIFKSMIESRVGAAEVELMQVDAKHELFDMLLATAHYICTMAFSGDAIPFQRLMIAESQRFPELMRQIFEGLYHMLHANVIETFEQLAAIGKIPQGNHAETTKFFIDLLLGTAPLQLTLNWISSGPSEKELRDKVNLFIAGRFGIATSTRAVPQAATRKAATGKHR